MCTISKREKQAGESPDNLITLCETCHDLIHRTHQEHKIQRKANSFRAATQMGILRWRVYERVKAMFPNVYLTFGRRSSGCFDLRTLDGTRIHASASYKQLKSVRRASARLIESRAAFSPVP